MIHTGQKTQSLNMRTGGKTRLPATSLAVSSHPGLDDKDSLKVNATKTKLMHTGTKRGDGVSVAGEQVEEVDEFTYLGSIASKGRH